ncbi:trigger factor [Pseudorhodoplanes sinuspersici]|uniref:Trigger factor n=1 Tax=Pseudorhodoplanes sinuspersici TaxID=1235591 RepID=A0A1W7A0L9_9HYPH|nr:trigger factor [Pseudorhodoplanes sinuspersici]ARQ03128.1 trigger factor [Pseudorhodoplanes sinuspersici]RKE73307.1 trigger factor [Pseudorhodoplanes sinuspersici]
MQVTETLSDGLRREFSVVIPAGELDSKVSERLDAMKDKVRINGFRPGKVPTAHLRRMYGRSAMAEAIDAAMRDVNSKIVADNNFRLAMQPKVNLPEDEKAVEDVINGKSDLAYTVEMEILAPIELTDFKSIDVTRLVTAVNDEEVDEGLKRIADQNRPFAAKAEGAKAEKDDRVTISFVGSIDGVPFDGGSADDVAVNIGSNTFIPGFEDQLVGITVGENRKINVTFPENYPAAQLAGKAAEFDVTAKTLEAPSEVKIDDEFAKSLGMESLDKLKDAVRERIQREHDSVSKQRVKRVLFDALDERHKFPLPPALVEQEFNNLWTTATEELKQQGRTFEDENTTEEKERAEYQRIADRRVRLGLLLDEIARRNNINVTDEETTRAIVEHVRQYPGREKELWDMFRNNPEAVASIRAPLIENKVTDFILALAKVSDKTVSREELYRNDEEAAA